MSKDSGTNKNRSKKSMIKNLSDKYRLVFLDNESFEEKGAIVLSKLSIAVYFLFSLIVLIALVFILISVTSLKEWIPGYPDTVEQELLKTKYIDDIVKLTELENKIASNKLYYANLEKVLKGDFVNDSLLSDSFSFYKDTSSINFSTSSSDSMLRKKISEREKYDISIIDQIGIKDDNLKGILFFSPLIGEITNQFNLKNGHIGIDIIASKNEAVKSVLEGTVLFSDWTPENGHIIQVQHNRNLISIYKHNSVLLKTTGDRVSAGEPIAIVGNSGSLSTGPHLHFELWYNGVPLDPEKFIVFE